jgi:tripeptidyl-peptidase-1
MQWLTSEGVDPKVGAHGDAVRVKVPAPVAERLFDTEFYVFTHAEQNITLLRAGKPYTLPEKVAEVVSLVGDILRFPHVQKKTIIPFHPESAAEQTDAAWPKDCTKCPSGWTTPAVLNERYNLGERPTTYNPKNAHAVAEFQGQLSTPSILKAFGDACGLDNIEVDTEYPNAHPSGATKCNFGGCTESLLDIEYIRAVTGAIPLTDVYSADYSLLDWGHTIMDMPTPPLVHSVSYGNDEVQQTGKEYMDEVNEVFKKAGVMGLSILFASGDQGVWGRSGYGAKFHPDFPGGSPYITAVGGTDFLGDEIGEETTWKDGGGGFSDTFEIPSYQKEAVAGYFASGVKLPPSKLYNAEGRGYPDVAALGGVKAPYCVHASSFQWGGVGGTSASCPVVAGVFTKLNDIRLNAGKSPMGFLNPFIYQNPDAFQDVTSGKNSGEYMEGFTATKGWDPATGYGTPDYEKLSKLV